MPMESFVCSMYEKTNWPVQRQIVEQPRHPTQGGTSCFSIYSSALVGQTTTPAAVTFEEAVDVLVRLVALHDDWLRGAPHWVLLRRGDHLHQLKHEYGETQVRRRRVRRAGGGGGQTRTAASTDGKRRREGQGGARERARRKAGGQPATAAAVGRVRALPRRWTRLLQERRKHKMFFYWAGPILHQ